MNKLADMDAAPFRLFLWSQRLLMLGPAFDTERHRHHAAQLAVGLGGPLRVCGAEGHWRQAQGFYVPPDVEHGFDAAGNVCALLYLDAESRDCVEACGRFSGDGIHLLAETEMLLKPLRALAAEGGDREQAEAACRLMLGQPLTRGEPRSRDPRLRAVLAWLDEHLLEGVRLAEVSRANGVSQSWLSHRFGEEIGVPLRRYLLWRRLQRALREALAGASLTEAAYLAGFADSAHLTRSFRDAFGVSPSLLFGARHRIVARFFD